MFGFGVPLALLSFHATLSYLFQSPILTQQGLPKAYPWQVPTSEEPCVRGSILYNPGVRRFYLTALRLS